MDLQSIAPATRTVALGGAAVEVTGLSLRKVTQLIGKHPELLALAAGQAELASLVRSAPESAVAIFALAVVGPTPSGVWWRRRPISREADQEGLVQAFDQAAAGQQLDILASIVDLTFKGERGIPFLRSLIGSSRQSSTPSAPEPAPSVEPNPISGTSAESSPTSSDS